jgi:exonuclease SbcC
MLDRLTLTNFQSHTYSELDFDPGVNVIVGPSDSGKTAIIRALRWLVWGRPLGDSFIHHGEHLCRVSVDIKGNSVTREKTKGGETSYRFLDMGYTALKTEVPEPIRQFLNMGEVNIQQQLDRPFLLDSSPGVVAEHWNRVVHLDVIDTGVKRILSWIRGLNQETQSGKNQLESLKLEQEKYQYVDSMETRISALESACDKASQMDKVLDGVNGIVQGISDIEERQKEYQALVKLEDRVNGILELVGEKESLVQEKNNLDRLISRFGMADTQEKKNKRVVALEDQLSVVNGLETQYQDKETLYTRIQTIVKSLTDTVQEISLQETTVKTLEVRFEKEFPDICPLCGQKVRTRNGTRE